LRKKIIIFLMKDLWEGKLLDFKKFILMGLFEIFWSNFAAYAFFFFEINILI